MYQALYRKWRPKTFSQVVGQDHITGTLQRQVAEGRTAHAYLFSISHHNYGGNQQHPHLDGMSFE